MDSEDSSMGARDRLLELRTDEAVSALYLETLSPAEALAELSSRQGPLFDLQRARFLAQVGRSAEAAAILEGMRELPQGLSSVRDRLRESLAPPVSEAAAAARQEGQRPEVSPAPADRLGRWLDRVHRWRSELRV
jgi:hypothetical protein